MEATLRRVRETHDLGEGRQRDIFGLVGSLGGVHFWVEQYVYEGEKKRFGGVEKHSRKPFNWSGEVADNSECWLIGGPCYHDGSSLMAEERFIPIWNDCHYDGDFSIIYDMLEGFYHSCFQREEADDE